MTSDDQKDTSAASSEDHGPLRSFGRRRARKLSPRQTSLLEEGLSEFALDLSVPAPARIENLFPDSVDEVWLEIGFGGGEHLLWQAAHSPNIGFLGCEPFIDGVVKVIDGARRDNLANIRLYSDDARDVLAWLPDACLARAFILFPDPWPKKRHIKRRLVQPELIASLARILAPGAELRMGTDIADYARGMLLAIRREQSFQWLAREPSDWRERPDDWPATRYEQKAGREGRQCHFLRFQRCV